MTNGLNYQLYTVPRCDGCEAVKSYLNEKKVSYDVFNLIDLEHKKVFGKIYPQVDGKVKKTVQNKTILPLLVGIRDSRVEKIAQGIDEVKNLFN